MLQALEDADSQVGEKVVAMAATSTPDFLRQLLSKVSGLSSLDLDSAEQLLRITVRCVLVDCQVCVGGLTGVCW